MPKKTPLFAIHLHPEVTKLGGEWFTLAREALSTKSTPGPVPGVPASSRKGGAR